jgi:hypothetical protein
LHSLFKATWIGSEMSRIEEASSSSPKRESPEGVRLVQELFDALERMGRSISECVICLSSLDPADPSHPIEVLQCMHVIHQACVWPHIFGRINDRGGSVCPTCRTPIKLTSAPGDDWQHPNLERRMFS